MSKQVKGELIKADVVSVVVRASEALPTRVVKGREYKKGVQRRGVYGRMTGWAVGEFIHRTLIANEMQPKNRKWTDTVLKEALLQEFPHAPSTVKFLTDGRRPNPIAYYRHRYNRGRLSNRLAPPILSVRYDLQGNAVEGKNVERLLTKEAYILDLYSHGMNVIFNDHLREYEVLDYDFFNKQLYDSLPTASKKKKNRKAT